MKVGSEGGVHGGACHSLELVVADLDHGAGRRCEEQIAQPGAVRRHHKRRTVPHGDVRLERRSRTPAQHIQLSAIDRAQRHLERCQHGVQVAHVARLPAAVDEEDVRRRRPGRGSENAVLTPERGGIGVPCSKEHGVASDDVGKVRVEERERLRGGGAREGRTRVGRDRAR